ncbi:MAG: ABC transporter permease [Bacteroidetes bacterium]|nr:MAG: ABC transporter permease [Bacteroidota bacterium]
MNKTFLIIKREYLSRVKKKSFIIMTILGPILIAGFISLAIYLGLSDDTIQNVVVVDQAKLVTNDFEESSKIKFFYTNEALSDSAFENSAYNLMLVVNEFIVENNKAVLYYKKYPSISVQSYINDELDNSLEKIKLKMHEIESKVYLDIRTAINIGVFDIKDAEEESRKTELAAVGFFFAIIIYMFILMYAVQVMRGVMEEKTTRIVEVLVSSVKPFQLMMGKIVGIAMVGLTQFLLWIILTTLLIGAFQTMIFTDPLAPEIIAQQQMTTEMQQELISPQQSGAAEMLDLLGRINFPLMIGMFIFYFLGGFLLYSALFAAVGAAVDSESETQQFVMPLTIPLVFGFIIGEFAIMNPDGAAVMWFSIVPFTSPVVMMIRLANGFTPDTIWQLYLSIALLIAGFVFTTWIASKIYRIGILMYGNKISYKELWKWLRHG